MAKCFVIGPIGDRLAPLGSDSRRIYEDALSVFEDVIRPACAANELEPIRADQIAKSGEITEQIYRHLMEDDVVIADVSGGNANVMYELGLRHTRDLLTLTIGEYGQIPFDISAIRAILFSRSERGLIDARRQLERALAVGLAEGSDPVTATRVWLSLNRSNNVEPAVIEVSPDQIEDGDYDGFFDKLEKVESVFPEMTLTMETITQVLDELSTRAEKMGAEVEAVNQSGSSAKQRLQMAGRWASGLQGPADKLSQSTGQFAQNMIDADDGVRGIFRHIDSNKELLEQAETLEYLSTLTELSGSARESMEGLNSLGGIVGSLGTISKVLSRPGRQMSAAIDEMAKAMALVDEWESEASRLLSLANQDGGPWDLTSKESESALPAS